MIQNGHIFFKNMRLFFWGGYVIRWHLLAFDLSLIHLCKCCPARDKAWSEHFNIILMILSYMCMLCRSLFVLLSFFTWPLCCLSFFNLRILITPLVSSNSSLCDEYQFWLIIIMIQNGHIFFKNMRLFFWGVTSSDGIY
jgi:hypothetical protein